MVRCSAQCGRHYHLVKLANASLSVVRPTLAIDPRGSWHLLDAPPVQSFSMRSTIAASMAIAWRSSALPNDCVGSFGSRRLFMSARPRRRGHVNRGGGEGRLLLASARGL